MIEIATGDVWRLSDSEPILVGARIDAAPWCNNEPAWGVGYASGYTTAIPERLFDRATLLCPATLKAGDRFEGDDGAGWTIGPGSAGKDSDGLKPIPSAHRSFRAACLAGHMRLVSRAEEKPTHPHDGKWFKQGNAVFRLEADGDAYRVCTRAGGKSGPIAKEYVDMSFVDGWWIEVHAPTTALNDDGGAYRPEATFFGQDGFVPRPPDPLTPKDANGRPFACGEYMAARHEGRTLIGRVVSITDEGRDSVVTIASDRGSLTLAAGSLYRPTPEQATRAANIDTHRIAKTHRPPWGTVFGAPTSAFLTAVDRVCAAANEGTPELLRVDTVLERARVLVETGRMPWREPVPLPSRSHRCVAMDLNNKVLGEMTIKGADGPVFMQAMTVIP